MVGRIWTGAMLADIAEAAADNQENCGYVVSAFLDVLATHLAAGDSVSLKGVGTLRLIADGHRRVEFQPARRIMRSLQLYDFWRR